MTINKAEYPCQTQLEPQWVLFDVGGVLVELEGVTQMLAWLQHRLTTEELWQRWLASPAVRAFETGRSDPHSFACALLDEFQMQGSAADFLDAFRRWPTRLFPGTRELLESIPPRYGRALLSNSNSLHWSRIIEEMHLDRLIERHFVSHLSGYIKPDANAFEHVLGTLGCPAAAVLFLDDNRSNVIAAQAVGMHARRVQGPYELAAALAEFGIITHRGA